MKYNILDVQKRTMYFIDKAEEKFFIGYINNQRTVYPVFVGDISVCCGQLCQERFYAITL